MRGNARIETFNANNGGAAYIRFGYFEMYDTSSIYQCTASDGGAFYLYQEGAHVTLNDQAKIEKCEASSDGGTVYMYGGYFTIEGGSIKQCNADSRGGAIFMDTTSGSPTVTLNNGTISNNTATSSGNAIYAGKKVLSAEATINISDDFVIDQSEIYRAN